MESKFSVEVNGDTAKCILSGRLDFSTAQGLYDELNKLSGQSIQKLIFVAGGLEYISSAGLRVILFAKKKIAAAARFYLIGAQENILSIFRISGMDRFITIRDALETSDIDANAKPQQSFPANKENLEAMLELITDSAKKTGFKKTQLNQIRLACEELLVNILNYAYAQGKGEIRISCQGSGNNSLLIEIRDSGPPFDPLQVKAPDVDLPLEERASGGLGIFLARKVMDKITYERAGDENILRLAKNA